jgi:hypothetical protein
MKLFRGRPKLTAEDHPSTVYAALLGSIAIGNRELPENVADAWVKTAQDAYEAVQDGFGIVDAGREPLNPEGEAVLYLSLDQLESALVNHGMQALAESDTDEVATVDSLLKSIDSLRE